MKIEFGEPIDFEIPLAKFPISDVPIRLMANRAAIKVFVLQTAHDQMIKHVNQDKNIECGGVLVGYPFQDEELQEIFVVVVGIIPDVSSNRSVVHFTVTPDTISRTREILEKDFPELIAVGWYHSHPGHGVFLSGQDMTIVRGIYSEAWNLAWVIDPIRNSEGIFWGADGEPVIANVEGHALFEKNNKIWFPIEKVPQCVIDLQAGKITYGEKIPASLKYKPMAENGIRSTLKPHREEIIKNKPRQLWRGWVLFSFSLLTLILLCVSVVLPGFLGSAVLMGIWSILIGFFVVGRFISINGAKGNSTSRNESFFALFVVFCFSFFGLLTFLANYMGIFPWAISVETSTPTATSISTEMPTPTVITTSTEMPMTTVTSTSTETSTPIATSTSTETSTPIATSTSTETPTLTP